MWLEICPLISDIADNIDMISFQAEICQEMLAGIYPRIMSCMRLAFPLFYPHGCMPCSKYGFFYYPLFETEPVKPDQGSPEIFTRKPSR